MGKRICVVGAGRWGRNHVKTLASLGHLAGIVESDKTKLRELGRTYPDVVLLDDVQKALEVGFDGFTVATPAELHASITEQILRGKKHVLVEKPLALSVADGRHHHDCIGISQTGPFVVSQIFPRGLSSKNYPNGLFLNAVTGGWLLKKLNHLPVVGF